MKNQSEKINVWLVPNTHWDREWVMTFDQFQIRLVNLVDNLLGILARNPEYRFYMDGQSICFEDYLEICPEKREELQGFMSSGQLVAGPWYVLADQFLQNGESTIRNLLIGMKQIEELGGSPAKVGYVPDSFGSCSSLPMILAGFGIRYATFGRGRPKWDAALPESEFWWRGPDGSEILTGSHGYSGAISLSYPDIWCDIHKKKFDLRAGYEKFLSLAESFAEKAATNNLYFSVGIDHMEPRESLVQLVEYINANDDRYCVRFATPEEYLQAVERDAGELKTYSGEMRNGPDDKLKLIGVLSTHIRLKQLNYNSEYTLENLLEPLCAFNAMIDSAKYPAGHMNKLWKLLISNHPHDSICGVSLDQVHVDMQNRYSRIEHAADYLMKDGLHVLLDSIDTRSPEPDCQAIVVVNPLGRTHSGPVCGWVRLPRRFVHDAYTLIDSNGQEIPCRVKVIAAKQKDLESVYMTNRQLGTVLSKDDDGDRPDDEIFTVLEVDFLAEDVPGCGHKTWWLKPGSGQVEIPNGVWLSDGGMENELVNVKFHSDGTFDLHDKSTGHTFEKLHYFVDREDIGDAYDYYGFDVPQEDDSRHCDSQWQIHEQLTHRITFKRTFDWMLPAKREKVSRSDEKLNVPVTVFATLHKGLGRIEMAVELENNCEDHCLRMALNTGLKTQSVDAGGNFDVVSREVNPDKKQWQDQPLQDFVDVSDKKVGLCLATRGLPAYEAVGIENGTRLYLTLLRAVGHLGPAAGADYPTPMAQSKGCHRFEYAIIPHSGDWKIGDVVGLANDYKNRFLADGADITDGRLSSSGSLFVFESSGELAPVLTCMKQAENGNGYILRFWNPAEKQTVKITSPLSFREAFLTNLREENRMQVKADKIEFTLEARSLITLWLVL